MFRGDHPELSRLLRLASTLARGLGHPRVGSEHLLLALAVNGDAVGTVLVEAGATAALIGTAVGRAAPTGAGAAADRDAVAPLGIDIDPLLSAPLLDRPLLPDPLLPFGAARARRRCARMALPLGLDAQAAYEASLRLALARRDAEHRPEHLALTLVALDPGATWVLTTAGIDPRTLLIALAAAFPPPRRNPLLRAERHLGERSRASRLTRRYERTTGRAATTAVAVATLITG